MILLIWLVSVFALVCSSFELQVTEKRTTSRDELLDALSVTIEALSRRKLSTIRFIKPDKIADNENKVNKILSGLKFTTLQIINSGSPQRKSLKNSLTLFWLLDEMAVKETLSKKNLINFTDSKMFLVFVEDKIENFIMTEMFETFLALAILDVNVLIFNGDNIVMVSFVPFRDKNCRNTSPVIVNVYNESKRKWSSDEIFPQKLLNFHRCPLRISTLEYPPAVMKKKKLENESFHYYGSDVEVISGLSLTMNFRANFAFIADPYDFGEVNDNGSTGAISHVATGKADMLMGFYFLSYERLKYLSHSHP